jgi:septum formation protein
MLYLASSSPRRSQLLRLGGWSFKVIPAKVDEHLLSGELPRDYVIRLAQTKAQVVAAGLETGIVLAADTIVVNSCRGIDEILGKPNNPKEAEMMLGRLRGHIHHVYTGLSVLDVEKNLLASDCCNTAVSMRNYTDEEMLAYIASGDPFDKAGAYAIQDRGFHPIEALEGCFPNVMGLPLCHVNRLLGEVGLNAENELTVVCRSELKFNCLVYDSFSPGNSDYKLLLR